MALLRQDLEGLSYRRPAMERAVGVRLHLNEAAEDWPATAREALLDRVRRLPFHRYPERQGDLTLRLQKRLGAPEGGVLLGPSGGALIDLVALAGLSAGDWVAIPEPGFTLYPLVIGRHGGRVRRVQVGTGFPLSPWLTAVDGAKQLWVTLPNNPSGAWITPEELEPLLLVATRYDCLVMLDEAYGDFAPRTHRLAIDRFENVLILRSFSKGMAAAGFRLGYLLGPPPLIARLAALQLPFSIPSISLEAADVALDHAGHFRHVAKATASRRDRLAHAISDRTVATSKGNFIHVAPDPSFELGKNGFIVRTVPATRGARVGIGEECTVSAVAATLGGCLKPPERLRPTHLLVLDVDGVLIEAEQSFLRAVAMAIEAMQPGLAWTDAHFRAFKSLGGFNNDFRLAAAAVALGRGPGLPAAAQLTAASLSVVESDIQELEPHARSVVQRAYAETRHLERPMVTRAELDGLTGIDVLAVLTGRPPEELGVAWQVLGFSLPAVCDRAPHLRKPQPSGLLQLADAFHADTVTFVGDTIDDAQCVQAAAAALPDVRFRFAAVGPQASALATDLRADTLRQLLPLVQGALR